MKNRRAPLTVTCPACPDLHADASDPTDALDLAGAHDDTHHGGTPTAGPEVHDRAVCSPIPAGLTPATCPHGYSDDAIPTPPGQTGQWWHCTVCGTDHQDPPAVPARPASRDVSLLLHPHELIDVLVNTLPAIGHAPAEPAALESIRLTAAGQALTALATDRYRVHRDEAHLYYPVLPGMWPTPFHLTATDARHLLATARHVARHTLAPMVTITRPEPDELRVAFLNTGGDFDTTIVSIVVRDAVRPYGFRFPDIDAFDARLSRADWTPTGETLLNPQFLADASRLSCAARLARGHLRFRFRADTPTGPAPVRITHTGRPTFTADLMAATASR